MPQDVASDQGLHCLALIQQILDNQQVVNWVCTKFSLVFALMHWLSWEPLCTDWTESLYADQIFIYFCIKSSIGTHLRITVLRVASGPRVKLASCKSALNSLMVYSTHRSKAVVPVLVLLFVSLWFILRGDLF